MSATPATHSPEWHQLRSKGIGASEVATIAGIGRWSSRWEIWALKTGLIEPDPNESTEAQRTGLRMEETLARWFAEDTGLYVAGEQMMVNHPRYQWVRATVDGLAFERHPASWDEQCLDIADALGPVQFKHTADAPWTVEQQTDTIVPFENTALPAWLLAQVQWEMLACGDWCERAWVYALHSFGRTRCYEVPRDPEGIRALFWAARRFWRMVETNTPPALGCEPDPGRKATADALAKAFGEGGGGEVDVDDLADVLEERKAVAETLRQLKDQKLELDNQIKARLGEAEVGLVAGRAAVTWKAQTRKEHVVKESTFRRLNVKGQET